MQFLIKTFSPVQSQFEVEKTDCQVALYFILKRIFLEYTFVYKSEGSHSVLI